MAEIPGVDAHVLVPVVATPTALALEVTGTFAGETDFISAVSKSSNSFETKVPRRQRWIINVSSLVDDAANPALDVLKDAWIAKTKLADVEFDLGITAWGFTGDAYVQNLGIDTNENGFVTVTCNLQGTDAVVAA